MFDIEEDEEEDSEKEKEPPMKAAVKKWQKLPVRRGATTRTHSNVLEDLKQISDHHQMKKILGCYWIVKMMNLSH